MDNNRVSLIAVDIIHVANIDIRLEIVERYDLSNIRQMLHDVGRSTRRTHFNILPNKHNFFTRRRQHMFP